MTDGEAEGDDDDTTDGKGAATATKKMTATFAIKGVQVQPQ